MDPRVKSRQHFWKHVAADWKLAVVLALPMFAAAMWFGISRGYEDIGLFAILMAFGTLHIAEMGILAVRRFREWRNKGRTVANQALELIPITSAEEGVKYLEKQPPSGDSFHLAISESFTFAGKPDKLGAGMAVMLDKILGLGYEPDGYEQKSGFRLYRYKKMH